MKRIILIIATLLLTIPTFSQSFKVNYKLTVRPGNSTYGDGCNNNINVRIFYRVNGGAEQSKLIFNQDLNGGGGTYNLPQTISGGDLFFTKVEIRTSRAWKRLIGGCGGNGSFSNSLRTTAINSRCSKYLSGSDLARWWITTLNIDMKPIVNLTPKDAYFCQSEPAIINSGFPNGHSGVYRWEFLDPVNTITTITNTYKNLLDTRDLAYQDWQNCERFNDGGGGGDPIFRSSSISTDKTKEETTTSQRQPGDIILNPGGNPSPACRRFYDRYVTAADAVRNYTGQKYYQRSIWRPIASENGKSIADIYLSELYSNVEDQLEAMTGKTIYVRINPNCSGDKDVFSRANGDATDQTAKIQFLSDPPPISKTEFNSPTCSYDPIDNFKIFFTRQLLSNERLNINLKKKLTQAPFTYEPIASNINISSFQEITPGSLYSYTWNPSNGNQLPEAGDYRIELSGASGNPFCNNGTLQHYFSIAIPPKVNFLTATKEKDVSCFNGSDGKIKITASGGSNSFKYSIDNKVTWSSTFSNSTIITGLPAGTTKVWLKDSNGCVDQSNQSRNVYLAPKTKITHVVNTDSSDIIHPGAPNATDGSISITSVSGGTPASNLYTYQILLNGDSSNVLPSQQASKFGFTISNLPKGTHKIRYTDSNGCPSEAFSLPPLNDPAPVNFSHSITNAICKGGNGQIKVSNITGGYANYKIKLTKSGMTPQEYTNVPSNTEKIFTVGQGTYTITVTDTRSGEKIKNNITVTEPNEIVITNVNATAISCNGGKSTVTISVSGGQSGIVYEYAIYKTSGMVWQSSNVFSLDANPTIGYRFVARDKNQTSCKSQPSSVLRISEPTEISLGTPTIVHNTVFNGAIGEIQLPISGGTPGYTVTWTRNGLSTGKTGATITGLLAGTYVATVKDANNCLKTSGDIIVDQPDKLEVNITIDQAISCNGENGIVRANATGGSESYTYKWYRNNVLISGASSITYTGTTGNYKVEVNDGYTSTVSAVKNLSEPTLVQLSLTKEDITCNALDDGKIKLNISGGTSPYYFSIDDKTTFSPVSSLSNSTITGLTDGTFNVWIKDANDCEIAVAESIVINRPTLLEISNFTIINNQIINESKGEIQIEVNGGTPPYTYQWTDKFNPTFSEVTQNIANLPASLYSVIVKDANNCEITQEFEVKEPLPLAVTITQTNSILCFNDNTGALFAEVTGGYPLNSIPSNFDYKWYRVEGSTTTLLNGSNFKLDKIENLKAGFYRVVVNDVKGTSTSKDFEITEPARLVITIDSQKDVSCFEGNDGEINISVVGGTQPYSFSWSNSLDNIFSASSEDISGLKKGNYKVILTDANGCESIVSDVKIEQPVAPLSITDEEIVNLTGFETNNGNISVTVDGGTPNYNFEWREKGQSSVIGTTNLIENLKAGVYELTITDSKSCVLTKDFTLTQPELLVIDSININGSILCNGDKTVDLEVFGVTGGVAPYTYEWFIKGTTTIISSTSTLSSIGAGIYVVKVIDANDNEATSEYTVVEPDVLTISTVQSQNVSCFEGNDGFIDLTISGGVAPYTYSWKHGETTSRVENLKKGTYEVTVRDKNLCEVTQSFTITEPSVALGLTNETVVNLTGFETGNGSISVDAIGGTPNYTYEWRVQGNTTIIGTTNSLSNLSVGVYELTVIDSNSCRFIKEFTVTQPDLLEVDIQEPLSILCHGDNGRLTTNVTGGVAPYSYEWTVKNDTAVLSSVADLENTSGNIYVVKVLDANGNEATSEYSVFEPEILAIANVQSQNVSCFDGNNGFIDLTVNGGTAPYTYSWKHGETTSRIEDLKKGTYEVTIRDKNLCEVTQSFVITQPSSRISLTNISVVNLTGFQTGNGSISVDVLGGTPGYTYEWRVKGETATIGNSNSINNLSANYYELTVIDANSCSFVKEFLVTQPSLLEVNVQETLPILCNSDTGTLNASVTGGVAPYTYEWTVKNTSTVISTSNSLDNTSGNVYEIKVVDANGNATIEEFTVVEPEVLTISNVVLQNVSCFEGDDAFIDLTISGGVAPYSYNWKHGETTSRIENLKVGTYEVTIRDKNLCEVTQSFTITEPSSALNIVNENIVNLTGFETANGSISIDVTGGVPSYVYAWRIQGSATIIGTSNSITNLNAGIYELTLTDTSSCSIIKEYEVTQPDLLEVDVQESLSILCNGDKGTLETNVTGGVSPYNYEWTVKGTSSVINNSAILENVEAGIYLVKVTDVNGNETIAEYTITQPTLLEVVDIQTTDVTCYNGSDGFIDITVNGGVPPYTYNWNHTTDNVNRLENINSGNYSVTISDINGCEIQQVIEIKQPVKYDVISVKLDRPSSDIVDDGVIEIEITGGVAPYTYLWTDETGTVISNQTSSLLVDRIENLSEGTYNIVVTDASNCIINETYNLANPGEILVSITQVQDIKCYNSSNAVLDVITVGGVGGNTYQWFSAENDQLIGTEKQLTNIPAGEYYVVVSNAEGIQEKSSVFVVTQPEELIVNVSISNASCFGLSDGNFEISVQGGSGNYEYRYRETSGYSNWSSITGNNIVVGDLPSGNYTLQVRDINNCLALNTSANNEFSLTINEPEILGLSNEEVINLTGFETGNGSISVEVVGGTPNYSFEWFDGSGSSISTGVTELTNLAAGTYSLSVIDANGCSLTKEFVVTQPDLLEVSLSRTTPISCNGANDGSLLASVTGGVSGYVCQWFEEGSTTVLGTTWSLTDLGPGNYYAVITDANSNTVTSATYSLAEPTVLELSLSSDYVSCGTGNNWTINTSVTGGTAPYIYLWSNGVNSANLTNVVAGTYEVTVVDANGCRVESTAILTAPVILELSSEEVVNLTGFETGNGSISVEVLGGTPNYSYEWFDGSGNSIATGVTELTNLVAGTYTFRVTDAKGCSFTKEFTVTQPDALEVSLSRTGVISCNGANDGSLLASVTGGVLGYVCEWFAEGSSTVLGTTWNLTDLGPGNYYAVITDANSNTVTSSVYSLVEPTVLELSLFSDYVLCGTGNDWTINTTVTGGTAPYTYLWNTGANTADLTDVLAGTYEVTVVDANGCRVESTAVLTAPAILELSNEEVVNLTGFETGNGSVSVEVVGGTPNYSYEWFDGLGNSIATGVTELTNLAADTYTFIVTDSKGCSLTKEFTVAEPDPLEVSITRTTVISCNGANDGSLEANVSGGVSGYIFEWFKEGNTTVLSSSPTITNLGPGNYYVVITDANSNTVTSSTFTLLEPTVLELSLSSDYVLCGTGNDWTINTSVSGGTAPYVYLWSTGASAENLSDINAGTYEVTIVDANGCKTNQSITLTAPDALSVENEVITNPTCFEGNDGSISVNILGGTPPYEYEWTNGDTTESSQGLSAGNHEVIITDSKGCSTSKVFIIENPEQIVLDLGEDVTLCQGQNYILDGRIENGVTYNWTSSNGFTSSDAVIEVAEEGVYKVTAINSQGCQVSDEIEIKRSTEDISANFLMSSQVYTNEVFVAVNVSDPVPDELDWILPPEATIKEVNNSFAEISFDQEGEYEITLYTKKGDCEAFLTKKVLVLEREFDNGGNGDIPNNSSPIIQDLVIYPNPSSGVFALEVTLKEVSPVSVKIFTLVGNDMIDYKKMENESEYKIDYNLNLTTGLYFVVLESEGERIVKKIIIQ